MAAIIIDSGRGPIIDGTRITIYDVVDYWKAGWRYDQIAGLFRLPGDDIQVAIQYIEEHKEEVMVDYEQILERQREMQCPPEMQEKLTQNRHKLAAKMSAIRSRHRTGVEHAGDHGRS